MVTLHLRRLRLLLHVALIADVLSAVRAVDGFSEKVLLADLFLLDFLDVVI